MLPTDISVYVIKLFFKIIFSTVYFLVGKSECLSVVLIIFKQDLDQAERVLDVFTAAPSITDGFVCDNRVFRNLQSSLTIRFSSRD